MSELSDQDQRELAAALVALATEDPQAPCSAADGPPPRDLIELAGLLAYQLEPAPVPADASSRLLGRLGLASAGGERDRPAASERRLRWLLAAATVGILALAVLAVSLGLRLDRQGERLAALERRFGWLERAPSDDELAALQASVRFLSSRGMAACGLDPMSPEQPEARGTVYMNVAQGRWMLAVRNLAPTPPDRIYRIWFVTEAGPVSGGSFRVERDGRLEIGAEAMPAGLRAVSITLEPVTPVEQPTGPQILYGDEAHQIL